MLNRNFKNNFKISCFDCRKFFFTSSIISGTATFHLYPLHKFDYMIYILDYTVHRLLYTYYFNPFFLEELQGLAALEVSCKLHNLLLHSLIQQVYFQAPIAPSSLLPLGRPNRLFQLW